MNSPKQRFINNMLMLFTVSGTFLAVAGSSAPAQSATGYTRKSISHPTTILTIGNIHLSEKEEMLFTNAINTGIQIARFDYNPLPEKIQTSFKTSLYQDMHITEDELEAHISATLVPEIINILDLYKEIRAQKLLTDAQRNSFIALKAKESGITAQQLEQIMNSAYLYIPFISKYNSRKIDDKEEIEVSLAGGLLWYHVIAGDNPRIEKITRLSSEATATIDTDDSYTALGSKLAPKEYAFWSAANTLAMNLEILTRELDMFKLSAPIAEIQRRKIRFPLGAAEGIHLDDPFFVGEWYEGDADNISFRKSGFVRVSTVVDNRSPGGQLSEAVAIKKGDWSRGMMIVEHPRLGIDIAWRPRWFRATVEEGFMTNFKEGFVVYFDDYSGNTIGLDMNFQWNIASLVNRRQTFLVFGGTVSALPVRSVIFDYKFWDADYSWLDLFPVENWVAGLFYGYAGYLKRAYLGPFALHGEASLGTQVISTGKIRGQDFYTDEDRKNVTISNYTVGVRLNVGLEYAVNIDCNVGIFAGVQAFPPIDWWTVKYGDKEVDIQNMSGAAAPKFFSYSSTFGLYVHFSPPTLPFNPAAIFQNQMKNMEINR
ncbi:MAG: hypothetical protein ACP5FZ_00430 [Fidelibacterota bacterium]